MSKKHKKTFRSCTPVSQPTEAIVAYGVGMDVHKHKINVAISARLQTEDIVTIQSHVFRNSPYGLEELVAFLSKYFPVSSYLMECTGVYHLPVFHKLQKAFPNSAQKVVAMNPLLLHRRTGDLGLHSDKADAIGLSNFAHYTKLIQPSYIGSMGFFRLRELIRLHHRNATVLNRTVNRITSVLDGENFKFPLKLQTEWGLELLDRFISQEWSFQDAFKSLLKEKIESGKGYKVLLRFTNDVEEFGESILNSTSRFILQMHLSKLLYSQGETATYHRMAKKLVLNDLELTDSYKKLMNIPSVGSLAALTLIVELGDYSRFSTRGGFVKFCGVVPTIDLSGESHKRGHLNRHTNKFIRKVLTQSAGVLINRTNKDCDLARYAHKQFKQDKLPYKLALMKVANKLAKTVYNILILSINYDPNHEFIKKREDIINKKLSKSSSLMESRRTRALKRDISTFLVGNFDFLNSISKYHLTSGFNRLIRKSEWLNKQDNSSP